MRRIRYAITGPPNVGKSTLFIALTGFYAKTSNYPGTTLEIHRGQFRHGETIVEVTDLPGIVRPEDPLDDDEKIAVKEIVEGEYDGVLVVAAPHLWREALRIARFVSRYRPVILVFNMVDIWRPPYPESVLSRHVSAPVVYVSAVKGFGIGRLTELMSEGVAVSSPIEFDLETPRHTTAFSLLFTNRIAALATILAIAFASIIFLVSVIEGVTPWGSLPFSVNGSLEALEERVSGLIHALVPNAVFSSFLADGVWGSMVTLVSISLYVLIALVLIVLYEESGVIAHLSRGAEGVLARLGMPPRGVVCLFMGMSCNVPALASARVLWGCSNRTLIALMIPFMPCAARLAIFASVATAALINMPHLIPLMVLLPYPVSLAAASLASLFYQRALRIKPTPVGYVPEAPVIPPHPKMYVKKLAIEFRSFLQKVGPPLLLFLILLWPLKAFGLGGFTGDVSQSLIAEAGKALEPAFSHMEWPWQVTASLLAGWIFKETILGVLDSTGALSILSNMSISSVVAYLVFVSFYSGCAATLLNLLRIVGVKTTLFSIATSLLMAYAFANLTYLTLSTILQVMVF